MNIKQIREIQATGTSHDTIEAIIKFLESEEKGVTTKVKEAVKKVVKKK